MRALEGRKRGRGLGHVAAEGLRHGDGRRGVGHVVPTGVGVDGNAHDVSGGGAHAEVTLELVVGVLGEADVVAALVEAVGHNLAAGGLGELDVVPHVAVDHDGARVTDKVHELAEGLLDVLQGAVVVEVVSLDVGNHHDVGVEIEEGAVGLVGLADEIASPAVAAVGAVLLDDAADEEGGVHAQVVEHAGDHRGRRGLAVRAGNGDRDRIKGEVREHLRSGPDGDAQLSRSDDLGVGLGDGRGGHDDVGGNIVDGGRLVAQVNLDAGLLEVAGVARLLEVGAAHLAASLVKDKGDAAHAGAADTDEVGALDVRRNHGLSHESLSMQR